MRAEVEAGAGTEAEQEGQGTGGGGAAQKRREVGTAGRRLLNMRRPLRRRPRAPSAFASLSNTPSPEYKKWRMRRHRNTAGEARTTSTRTKRINRVWYAY